MDKDLVVLKNAEIKEKLKNFPGWTYKDNKILKKFEFGSFSEGLELVNKLAPFCNRIDHHPDIHIYYKNILFELQRFSVGGRVTKRDFRVAAEIERLYKEQY